MSLCRPIWGGVQSRNSVSHDRKPAAEAVEIHHVMALKRWFGVLGAVVRARDVFFDEKSFHSVVGVRFRLIFPSGALPGLDTERLKAERFAPVDGDAAGQPVSSYLQEKRASGVKFAEIDRGERK